MDKNKHKQQEYFEKDTKKKIFIYLEKLNKSSKTSLNEILTSEYIYAAPVPRTTKSTFFKTFSETLTKKIRVKKT